MTSVKSEQKGLCGKILKVSVWKKGHSIRCEKRKVEVRYWKPTPDIRHEIKDFCNYCEKKGEASQK